MVRNQVFDWNRGFFSVTAAALVRYQIAIRTPPVGSPPILGLSSERLSRLNKYLGSTSILVRIIVDSVACAAKAWTERGAPKRNPARALPRPAAHAQAPEWRAPMHRPQLGSQCASSRASPGIEGQVRI